jgi:hypothetical protein
LASNADRSNCRENITDWAINQFRSHHEDKKISKWDILHYVLRPRTHGGLHFLPDMGVSMLL